MYKEGYLKEFQFSNSFEFLVFHYFGADFDDFSHFMTDFDDFSIYFSGRCQCQEKVQLQQIYTWHG